MERRSGAGTLRVTDDKPLPGQDSPTPHVFIGDEAFPLKHYVMWPYPYRQAKVDEQKVQTVPCQACCGKCLRNVGPEVAAVL